MGLERNLGQGTLRSLSAVSETLGENPECGHVSASGRSLWTGDGLENFFDAITVEDDVVHIDGKRVRGANRNGQGQHFIEALGGGKVIDMVEMGAGAEGPAIEKLVRGLEPVGKIVTIDAAATTPAVAAAVRQRQGD
jgi:hypothetical protein